MKGDSPLDSLTLTAVFVGSASAGFEFRHPIATRASVSGAGAVGNVGSRATRIKLLSCQNRTSSTLTLLMTNKSAHSTQMNLMLRQTMGAIFARR